MDSPPLIRKFISQKMGRGTGAVVGADDDAATVVLEFADAAAVHQFAVDRALFRARFPDAADIDELIVRIALTRVHRDAGHAHLASGELRLSAELPPWIGDFAVDAGSHACGAAGAASADLRSANAEMEAIVETGVELQRVAGRRAAASAMQSANVPQAVIRRVLSNSTSRRQAATEADPQSETN